MTDQVIAECENSRELHVIIEEQSENEAEA